MFGLDFCNTAHQMVVTSVKRLIISYLVNGTNTGVATKDTDCVYNIDFNKLDGIIDSAKLTKEQLCSSIGLTEKTTGRQLTFLERKLLFAAFDMNVYRQIRGRAEYLSQHHPEIIYKELCEFVVMS